MKTKIIFHINETDTWRRVLNNTVNLLASYAEQDLEPVVEVLANGEAVRGYLTEGKEVSAMKELADQGVVFVACNHSLKAQEIAAEQLAAFVTIVPAGIRELADRQMEGFAYIKP